MESRPYTIDTLIEIMARLRDPNSGCPWDLKQSWQSIIPHTLEEAYEVADAIHQAVDSQDFSEVKLELGDLLFQVIFYSQFAKEQGDFEFADVVDGVCEKLIRRHPHVFADIDFADEAAIKANWEAEKSKERAIKLQANSVLDDVPKALPALSRAQKLQKRCANVGFDWGDAWGPYHKVKEEWAEVGQAMHQQDGEEIAEEIGDLLFAVVNLARHQGLDAEDLLHQANRKFETRFRAVEQLAKADGKRLQDMSLEAMDALWEKVKQRLKT
ncbi:nucleoside triphosphate pyrophosphohydrolase [Aliagarivorans taiwanensis]|uniref:nucleoside triphosphate pyrophosphohydrolase n=1 Tax=Aliagarivorans taiwanensis TaxID=561966 RepID=UPI000406E6C5|nr:nucleoside triphosphate pyrophosphohydrolase [Aliagarivorans taiwanensis]